MVIVYDLSLIYLSFENVCEIYTLDGAKEGLEKCLATNVYKKYWDRVIFGDYKNALKKQIKKDY